MGMGEKTDFLNADAGNNIVRDLLYLPYMDRYDRPGDSMPHLVLRIAKFLIIYTVHCTTSLRVFNTSVRDLY